MDGLTHVDWTKQGDSPKLRLYVTDSEGYWMPPVLIDLPFRPYFHAYKDVIDPMREMLKNAMVEDTTSTFGGRALVKVSVDAPDRVVDLREAIGTDNVFEADVPYGRRVMIDIGLSLSMPKRYLYYDLEADPSRGMPSEERADMPILSIAGGDNEGNEFFCCEDTETATITKFLLTASRYPVWCTFAGNRFDWPYLINRCRNLNIEFWFERFVHIDLLAVYKYVMMKRQDVYSLDFIAKAEELGIEKVQIDISRLREYYEKDRATLKEYNLGDVRVTRLLDQKLHMVEIVFGIAAISHTNVKDLLRVHEQSFKEYNTSVAVDGLVLRLSGLREPRVVWPTKKHVDGRPCPECETVVLKTATVCPACGYDLKKKKYAGALVLPPVPGVHKNVVMLDVNSLYPTIIQSFNMGLETFHADDSAVIKSPVGRGSFDAQPKSIFAEGLEHVIKIRREYKKRMLALTPKTREYEDAYAMDYAHKVLANSFYGVIGSDFSRYYSKDVAENITLTGQKTLGFLKDNLERIGMTIIMGDTDSVGFVMPEATPESATMIAERLSAAVIDMLAKESGVRPTLFSLDVQRICSAMFIPEAEDREGGTKKRYAALVTWENKSTLYLMLRGFEAVRHDSSQAQKDFQTQGLMLVMSDPTDDQKHEFLDHWWGELSSGRLNEKIVMHKALGKDPKEYKVIPPYLRVGRQLEAEGKKILHKGDKISYVKVGPKPEQVVAVLPGEQITLTPGQHAFIWDSQFVRIARRLGLPVETKTVKRERKGAQQTL